MSSLIAGWVLDAIESWADDYIVLRETGIAAGLGRYDALLVPVGQRAHCMRKVGGEWFARPRLCAIEVKVSRPDFLRGLRGGQFQRYGQQVAGLYVASVMGVCKTSELPDGVGHLVVRQPRGRGLHWTAVCKRHPKYREVELPTDVPWRLMFALQKSHDKALLEERDRTHKALKRMGNEAAGQVFAVLRQIKKRVESQDYHRGTETPR